MASILKTDKIRSMTLKTLLHAGLLCLSSASVLFARQIEERMVIASGVNCREQPASNSAVVVGLRLGDRIRTEAARMEKDTLWFRVSQRIAAARALDHSMTSGNCWVAASLTSPFSSTDPAPALIAAADRALKRDDATFEDLVAVENLFGWEPFSQATAASGSLQGWRLRVIDTAASRIRDAREPLPQAWIVAHRDLMLQSPFSRNWRVPPRTFWDLYARHEGQPGADEIAWAGAQAPIFGDECFTECVLNLVSQNHMQYWTRLPHGNHITEAVAKASERAEHANRFCILTATERIDPQQTRTLTTQVRSSLTSVTTSGKDELLRHLSEIDRNCANRTTDDLKDRRNIPDLTRALGLGFSITRKSLADFGDEAAAAVLEVVRSDTDHDRVEDGLRTLKLMIDGSAARPVSTTTRDEIRRAAQERLNGPQYFTVLMNAIDLAVALQDANLRRIVESLASDATNVRARGVEPEFVPSVQQRAARALAGK